MVTREMGGTKSVPLGRVESFCRSSVFSFFVHHVIEDVRGKREGVACFSRGWLNERGFSNASVHRRSVPLLSSQRAPQRATCWRAFAPPSPLATIWPPKTLLVYLERVVSHATAAVPRRPPPFPAPHGISAPFSLSCLGYVISDCASHEDPPRAPLLPSSPDFV